MRVFEIAGKLALFLAGLSAIVDLIDPAKLQHWSRRANEYAQRRSEYRIIGRIAELRDEAHGFFVKNTSVATVGGVVPHSSLVHTPPQTAPSGLGEDAFVTFWHTVMDELRDTYDLRDGESREKVLAASALVERRIDEFLSRELPESERGLVSRATDAKERSFGLAAVLMMLATIAMVVAANTLDLSGLAAQGQAVRILGFVGVALTVVAVFTLAAMPLAMPGAVEGTLLGTAARFLRFLARPVRPVRITALFLFVGGSLIDLVVLLLE
ncbi:hypothetical protein ONA91_13770 [Micromonospora sp. DR5-3]|uniref:hypothetical protein n=1 Tax=unclassified Micromonospora TaxID=2617518 RepID=UPI0011D6B438|nr:MULTISPECIES: hypothetical protein [unclassified Micromonospora]MCW3815522.1 hypothetical protein [Micromonospora sp. DR5-3]TYC24328.1 hypothetical protein FXF52_11310 [Micromonospora sp. MP36]